MPKRKSPLYRLEETDDGNDIVYLFIVNERSHMFYDIEHAKECLYFANEAYAHGYRNGMRAGRKG